MLRAERSHTVLSNIADRRKKQATGSRYITYMWTNLEKGTWNGYDGRFPVDRIKNSVFKRPAPGQPFVQGQKGHPSDERARTMARGVCLLVCALFTQRQPPTMRQKTLSFFAPLSCTLRNIGVDKPTMYCGTLRAIPANRAGAWRFYYEKPER